VWVAFLAAENTARMAAYLQAPQLMLVPTNGHLADLDYAQGGNTGKMWRYAYNPCYLAYTSGEQIGTLN
jgi:hypothetical protein